MTDLAKLRELLAKATKGLWYAGRVEPTSATADHTQPYSPWIEGGGPRLVQVGRSIAIHADDMALIAALRNEAPALLDEVEKLRTKLAEAEHMRDRHANAAKALDEDVTKLETRVKVLEAALRDADCGRTTVGKCIDSDKCFCHMRELLGDGK